MLNSVETEMLQRAKMVSGIPQTQFDTSLIFKYSVAVLWTARPW